MSNNLTILIKVTVFWNTVLQRISRTIHLKCGCLEADFQSDAGSRQVAVNSPWKWWVDCVNTCNPARVQKYEWIIRSDWGLVVNLDWSWTKLAGTRQTIGKVRIAKSFFVYLYYHLLYMNFLTCVLFTKNL